MPTSSRRGKTRDAVVVLSTMPDARKAAALAHALVSERLAACVNIVPGVRSIYRWNGKVQDDPEVLCVVKTTRRRYAALEARIAELHPYEVPEVVGLQAAAVAPSYDRWVTGATRARGR